MRILDVWTAHYYPQSGEFWSGETTPEMQGLRNRSTRSLWDPNYVDESWIGTDGDALFDRRFDDECPDADARRGKRPVIGRFV